MCAVEKDNQRLGRVQESWMCAVEKDNQRLGRVQESWMCTVEKDNQRLGRVQESWMCTVEKDNKVLLEQMIYLSGIQEIFTEGVGIKILLTRVNCLK